ALEGVQPAKALRLETAAFRIGAAEFLRTGSAVGFAKGMAAGDQRHGLLVIHRHAAERFANVPRGGERIGFAVGSFRIDVDEAHLHGAEWIFEFPVAGVTLVAEPL